ncbi:MAG: ATP-binding protein, partial [Cyanobacteriota bacterium]
MITLLKNFFNKLEEEEELEKRFFRYISFYLSVSCFFALLLNLFLGLGLVMYLLPIISTLFFSICFYYSKYPKNFIFVRNIFLIGFVILLDFFYFFNGGLDSSIIYIFIVAFLLISLFLKRKETSQILAFAFYSLDLFFLFYLEKKFPNLVTHYQSIEVKEIDLISSFIIISFFISIIINLFKLTYEKLLTDIDKKNKALIYEKEKAQEANNAKKDFLSIMTHEIRTPLNAIISISSLLQHSNQKKDEHLLKTLKNSSENLLSLVSDILDFSKIEEGEIKLEEIDFNIKDTIQNIADIHNLHAKERNNSINIVFTNFTNFNFCGDSLRLTQIITNLLSNAIKFTKDGMITIKIIFLEDNYKNNTSKIYFEIKDNGVGIEEENQINIFEKFTQENTSITRKYGGSGLGLSITKNLLNLMNSEIKLESE